MRPEHNDTLRYRALRLLEHSPHLTQRDLARELGVREGIPRPARRTRQPTRRTGRNGTNRADPMTLSHHTAPDTTPMDLLTRLDTQQAQIGILGLGYVGLPLMPRYAEVGYPVLGFDIDPAKVDQLNAGQS